MGYKVSAPMVYLRVPDVAGALVSYAFYQGAVVPENVDKDSLQHHLDGGLVVKDGDPLADVLAVPAGTPIPGEPPNVPVTAGMGGPLNLSQRIENVQKAAPKQAGKSDLNQEKAQDKPAPEPAKPEPPRPGQVSK